MPFIPDEVLQAVRSEDDAAFDALASNETCCFKVDRRDLDEDIVTACESILQTGKLSTQWIENGDEETLFILYGDKRVKVPLKVSAADRHITLLSLNEALSPDFEVRMLYASA